MCGVPYGNVDVDRLLATLTLVETTPGGSRWACRRRASARWNRCSSPSIRCTGTSTGTTPCARRRACSSARCAGAVRAGEHHGRDARRGHRRRADGAADHAGRQRARGGHPLARLYKRALDLPASDVPGDAAAVDRATIPTCSSAWRTASRRRWAWRRASCCSIFPRVPRCSPWTCRSGPAAGRSSGSPTRAAPASSGLPRVADELYRSARRFRVFVVARRTGRSTRILDLLPCPPPRCRRRVDEQVVTGLRSTRHDDPSRLFSPTRPERSWRQWLPAAPWPKRTPDPDHRLQEQQLRVLRQVGGPPPGERFRARGPRRRGNGRHQGRAGRSHGRPLLPHGPRRQVPHRGPRARRRYPSPARREAEGRGPGRAGHADRHAGHGASRARQPSHSRWCRSSPAGKTTPYARH